MYRLKDYIRRGDLMVNNLCFPEKRKLSTLMIYATSICNSRCKHCNIWAKRPVENLSYEKIVEILNSKCITSETTIGLEGGEFILHPEYEKILDYLQKNHPKYDLLSNCLLPEKVIDAVKKYTPERLYLSLDGGNEESYKNLRGVEGYSKVIEVIRGCRDIVPISIMFTITPWNDFDDLKDVIHIASEYDIDIRIGIYNNMDFFDTKIPAHAQSTIDPKSPFAHIDHFAEMIPEEVKSTSENYDFLLLYDSWIKGETKLRCQSITDSIVIHPSGNVPICQNLPVILGNVHEKSLDEILRSRDTINLQKEYCKNCNKCWINFHRKYDIVLLRSLEKLFPKRAIECFYGRYQWDSNPRTTYKKHLNSRLQCKKQ
jgi:MoaA/NifB/PqqE/SkfB family radical SAM enzyme